VISAYLSAYKNIVQQIVGHSRYGVATNRPLSLKNLVFEFEQVLGVKVNVNWGKRPYRNREVMVPWLGSQKLFNWEARVELDEGLIRSFG